MSKDYFLHERLLRGENFQDLLGSVTIVGCGATGSNLADNLVRQGFKKINLIDFDRVEEHNLNNQIYSLRIVTGKQ